MSPEVSVIIPTYNRAPVLERAIGSVLGQSFRNFELIVVDDGSTDGTQDVLNSLGREHSFHCIRQINQGVSAARNHGIRVARGKWLAFLDSDDEWLPQKLEFQLEKSLEDSQCPLIHGEEIWIRDGVRVNPMKKHQKKGGDVFKDAVRLCCISPSTVMLKKDLIAEVGFFREDFPVCEDYDLWLRILSHHKVSFVNKFLIKKYGGHEDQLSRKYRAMDYWRILSLHSVLQDEKLCLDNRHFAQVELKKKANILLKGYRKHQNLIYYDEIFKILKTHQA